MRFFAPTLIPHDMDMMHLTSTMGHKPKTKPRRDNKNLPTFSSLRDILREEAFWKSIEERDRTLQIRKTEEYFDRILSSRLQQGDPYLRVLTRMPTETLEDEYYALTKRLPEPDIETSTKYFDSGFIKGTRTIRIIKQSREYYMINMIKAELRRRLRENDLHEATNVRVLPPNQESKPQARGAADELQHRAYPGHSNEIQSESRNRQLEADNDSLRNVNLVLTKTVVRLNRRRKSDLFTEDQLREVVESNRKKNGTINYLKVSKVLGIHHTTAKRRLDSLGIR